MTHKHTHRDDVKQLIVIGAMRTVWNCKETSGCVAESGDKNLMLRSAMWWKWVKVTEDLCGNGKWEKRL